MKSVINDNKKNEIIKNPHLVSNWTENITEIDLSNKRISSFSNLMTKQTFPQNLKILNLSWNDLTKIPIAITKLKKLKKLDVSNNLIKHFYSPPDFYESIEHLNLSHNELRELPLWVWTRDVKNLLFIDLSSNPGMWSDASVNYAQLMDYDCRAKYVNMENCRIKEQTSFLGFFPFVNELLLGSPSGIFANTFEEVPCIGLSECLEIERLNLCKTRLFDVNSTIDIYKNLVEIDLSQNYIRCLPKEFCNLEKLEICVLSSNYIRYLPDEFVQLKNLIKLYVNDNELCMVPEKLFEMPALKSLDLYNNELKFAPEDYGKLLEIDLAQNYLEEPANQEYVERKMLLRSNNQYNAYGDRIDGMKSEGSGENHETEGSGDHETGQSPNSSLSEDCSDCTEADKPNTVCVNADQDSSSEEDWDSDACWDPTTMHMPYVPDPPRTLWNAFVQQKIREGNFYPADIHPVPVEELVRRQRLQNPKVFTEVEGQFDDLSDDETYLDL